MPLGPRLTGMPIHVVNGDAPVEHTAFANGRPSAGILCDGLGRAYERHDVMPFQVVDNIAVIPIEGTLVQKGAWIGQSSGETSYQGLMTQISRAATRVGIKGAVFEIDSFGGMVNGAFETAAAMRALSKQMPTISILTDYAYSAGLSSRQPGPADHYAGVRRHGLDRRGDHACGLVEGSRNGRDRCDLHLFRQAQGRW